MEILFGRLTYNEVLRFLQETDHEFQVPLSKKLNIPEYAAKLAKYSMFAYAKEGEDIIGMVSCYMNQPPNGYISNVCVKSSYQGKGLFRRMFNLIANQARERGIEKIRLEVGSKNTKAQSTYRKMGFSYACQARKSTFYFDYYPHTT